MKMTITVLIFLVLILVFQSCKENPITPLPAPVKVAVESIIPNHPLKIGEKFKMIVKVENLDSARIDYHYYINNQFHFKNTVNGDTIFSYIPYIPSNSNEWIIKVSAYTYDGSDYIYYDVQDTIDVITENCLPDICVKWSDLSRINEIDSYGYPGIYNEPAKWIAERNNDTITFSQTTRASDDEHQILKLILLDKGAYNLPEFLEFTIRIGGFSGQKTDTLKSGILKIQDWDTTGIISGIVLSELKQVPGSELGLPTRKVFWFNFSN